MRSARDRAEPPRREGNHGSPEPDQPSGNGPSGNGPSASPAFQIEAPSISLPKGGGAIRGIDEQFTVNPSNGTLTLTLSLPITPGRRGFAPPIRLSYDSGGGNGIAGIGWSLAMPSIRRRSDRGIPRYRDDDVFMLADADELVPASTWNGNAWDDDIPPAGALTVQRFRPRVERDFSRIEKITDPVAEGAGTWWRVMSRDNVTTFYGLDDGSRLADPEHADRVLQWLPSLSFDDLGNCCVYEYQAEDLANVAPRRSDTNRRNGLAPFANLHPKRVRYGNRVPYFVDENAPYEPAAPAGAFLFHLVFDYGQHDTADPTSDPTPGLAWAARPDPFSSYRTGFEVRTHRLLQRVLMFHQFDELNGGDPCLVRSLDLGYSSAGDHSPQPVEVSYLSTVTQCGYIRRPDDTYSKRSLPPIEFDYQPVEWSDEVRTVDPESAANLPTGVLGDYQWLDLYNEGIAGVFTEQADAWLYKPNLGDVDETGHVKLDTQRVVITKPALTGFGSGVLRLLDLDADGRKQIVVRTPQLQGYFELGEHNAWRAFEATSDVLRIDLADAHVRMLDLVGDGRADILVSEQDAFVWYRSLGRRGHEPMQRAARSHDEERGPAVIFTDDVQSVFLADMSGDGLLDVVRIRNGDVAYWPNRGYGRFGAKVAMDHPPRFDTPEQFDPKYLRLADVTGTGTTDLIYLCRDGCRAFLNLSGNVWSDAQLISNLPAPSPMEVATTDLLGNGTACVVWSSGLPADAARTLRYIDLMGGNKPHLLRSYSNNLGAEASIAYKSSTWFYLKDKVEGRPWATRLPFPVHCVRSVTTRDRIGGSRLVNSYRYHHGFFDATEREFRGFAMVEQRDAEDFANWAAEAGDQLVDRTLFQTPVLTKTWFHTGVPDETVNLVDRLRDEHWDAELARSGFVVAADEPALPESRIIAAPNIDPAALDDATLDLRRQAMRACRGSVLRREVFGLDAPEAGATEEERERQLTPYTVETHNSCVEVLQPILDGRNAVVLLRESEAITWSYERDVTDPRVRHTLNVVVDELANVRESATVVYGRRVPDATLPLAVRELQARTSVIYTSTEFTSDAVTAAQHRVRQPSRTTSYEISGLPKPGALYALGDFVSPTFHVLADSTEVRHQDLGAPPPGTVQRRMLTRKETVFYDAQAANALPLHQLHFRALPFESYELAFTPDLVTDIYGQRATPAMLTEGGYVARADANWWVPSGRWHYLGPGDVLDDARGRFFSHVAQTDPLGVRTEIGYFASYALLQNSIVDAASNRTQVTDFDLRTLSPRRVVDANDNISEALFDELGWVKAMALFGKGNEADDLAGLDAGSTPADDALIASFFGAASATDVMAAGAQLLQHASSRHVYDVDRFRTSGGTAPPVVATIVRERHFADDPQAAVQVSFEYSNGAGKVEMKKAQAEPGVAKHVRVVGGNVVIDDVDLGSAVPPQTRWVGTGRALRNNKGNVVKEYEPFFSVTHEFETAPELVAAGVTKVQSFDPVDRPARTDYPDGTFAETHFGTWKAIELDRNDTVKQSEWHDRRVNREIDAELLAQGRDPVREAEAAVQTEAHADTPFTRHVDAFGRPLLEVAHNGADGGGQPVLLSTVYERDVEGRRLSVTDPRGNVTLTYRYNMRGHLVSYDGPDGGARFMLDNVVGDPVRMWDERNHEFGFAYDDPLHRATSKRVRGGDGAQPLDHVFERLVYGEGRPNDVADNLRTRVAVRYDTAGRLDHVRFDLKGNLVEQSRRFASDYRSVPNFDTADPDALLDPETFTTTEIYDALDRVVRRTTPDGTMHEPTYNAANLLESVQVTRAGVETVAVQNIDYDARGLRTQVVFGNGVTAAYAYEPTTFRLTHLTSRRGNGDRLQDLSYTYDPVGNLTHLVDAAVLTVWFNNAMITGAATYTYDPLYRLIQATGREHAGQVDFGTTDNAFDTAYMKSYSPNDALVWRNYTERYHYDPASNIDQLAHVAGGAGADWTRDYTYDAGSNRLLSTKVGATTFSVGHHPAHGFVTSMPHLSRMEWNFRDELVASATQVVNAGTPETTWYVYDGDGTRLRKVTDREAGANSQPVKRFERYSLDCSEVQREYDLNGALVMQRHTAHVLDDNGRLAMIETDTTPGANDESVVRYLCINHLSSASLETDAQARVITYEEFHPFGTTAYQAVDKTIVAAAKRFRYTGVERDEESGLEYHAARYYAPWLGRWIAPDLHAHQLDGNRYAYVKNNPMVNRDRNGQYEETVHGAATYRLALAAGLTEADAAQIAIATAGMDHDAATRPGPEVAAKGFFGKVSDTMEMMGQIWMGRTQKYHFPSQEKALGDVTGDIQGGLKDLDAFGRHLHSLEDVGFKGIPGPHMRSNDRLLSPLVGTIGMALIDGGILLAIASNALVKSGDTGWAVVVGILAGLALAVGLYALIFALRADGTGHPTYKTERGEESTSLNHIADEAFQDPQANTDVLNQVYEVLKSAAAAKYGANAPKPDDAAKDKAIADVVAADNAADINKYLNEPVKDARGNKARSYADVVATQGRWSPSQIDSSLDRDREWQYAK